MDPDSKARFRDGARMKIKKLLNKEKKAESVLAAPVETSFVNVETLSIKKIKELRDALNTVCRILGL